MTAYQSTGVIISAVMADMDTVTLSGTVTDGSNPLSRQVVAFRHQDYASPGVDLSSPVDGSFSIEMRGGLLDRFLVVAIGEEGEVSTASAWVTVE